MKNPFTLSIAVFLIILTGLGCRMFGNSEKNSYLKGENAQNAAEKVKEKIGKPFKIFEIIIEENEFRLQVQDPDNPQNLDEYKVIGGSLRGPNPVQLNAMQKDLEKSTFPFDQINFAAISDFTGEALKKSQIEGAKVKRMTFQRAFAITENNAGALGNARWLIEIEGTRESVSAAAGPDGKLLGVDLSRTTQAANYKVIKPEELQKAQDALKTHLGENARVAEIVFYEDYLTCSVENPQNPNVADGYKFGINGLTESRLKKAPRTQFAMFADFSLNDINLLNAGDYVAQAKQRIEMPDSVLTSMTVRRKKESRQSEVSYIVWTVNFRQDVNEATVVLNDKGTIIQIRKNGKTIFEEKNNAI
jgi:hypothetical protein